MVNKWGKALWRKWCLELVSLYAWYLHVSLPGDWHCSPDLADHTGMTDQMVCQIRVATSSYRVAINNSEPDLGDHHKFEFRFVSIFDWRRDEAGLTSISHFTKISFDFIVNRGRRNIIKTRQLSFYILKENDKCEMGSFKQWLLRGCEAFSFHGPAIWGEAGGQRSKSDIVVAVLVWVLRLSCVCW